MKYAKTKLTLAVVIALSGLIYWSSSRDAGPQKTDAAKQVQPSVKQVASSKTLALPSTAAPQSIIPDNPAAARYANSQEQALSKGYGSIEKMPESAEKAQLVEAFAKIKAGHKEAGKTVSAFLGADDFDRNRLGDLEYLKAYAAKIQPGRCFQASNNQQDPELKLEGDYMQEVLQNKTAVFQIRSCPHSPVTATSHDGAIFASNQASSLTAIADASGLAEFVVLAPSGVISDCNFTASSPMARSSTNFILHALLPEPEVTVKK
jgi:hypothetical protein